MGQNDTGADRPFLALQALMQEHSLALEQYQERNASPERETLVVQWGEPKAATV